MRGVREFGNALVVAVVSIGLMLGALSISLVEFTPAPTPTPTVEIFPSPVPITATASSLPSPTPNANIIVDTPTIAVTATNTIPPSTSCQPPAGWIGIAVQAGDTLDGLAARYRVSRDALKSGNCLVSETLIPGTILYVPPAPTSTVVACIPGAAGWVKAYTVVLHDTFYNISTRYGVTVSVLKRVNCRISDLLFAGEVLWVPNVPTRTPTFTPLPGVTFTVGPILTEPFTETVLPFTITPMPSPTFTPSIAPTITPIPTETASPTAFPTPTQ